MLTLTDSLVSSSSRPLPIRVRPDLSAKKVRYQGQVYWVVKEPVGLNYYRFEEEEYAILNMLDGNTSMDEVVERFEEEFPPQTIRVEELQQFIGMLHRSGLVMTGAPGQGVQLKKRGDEKRRKELTGTMSNILAVRFKGFDPDRFLNFIYPYTRWFFTRGAFIFFTLFALSAALLVAVKFESFRLKLPTFDSFFAAQNWIWLALVLGITKMIHEFGHGLSCKHFGGECHEIGVMLLVLTPCLYCNVSDSWMLPSKWHRAAIGAAGMYVEIVIASFATYIFFFTEPGPLHYTCLNVMFIASVSTLMFNANPLLRYDGYYILSDIMEVPNMRQKASAVMSRKLGKWCLGLEEPEDPFIPQRNQWAFGLYSIASVCYRWFILFVILTFLNRVFEPYGLKALGQMIAMFAIGGIIYQPLKKLYTYFKVPGRIHKVKRVNVFGTLVVLTAAISAILLVPIPSSVMCEFELKPRSAEAVHVEVPGRLTKVSVKPGTPVKAGQELAHLENITLQIELVKLKGQLKAYEAKLLTLELRQAYSDTAAAREEQTLRENIRSIEEQIQQLDREIAQLELAAPRDGVVIPPPVSNGMAQHSDSLPSWSGTPLDPENEGAMMMPGERGLFCWVGDPDDLEASLVIDQGDIEFVKEGQRVEMILNQDADRFVIMEEFIADISPEELKETPRRLAGQFGGNVPTEMDSRGIPRPLSTSYLARVPIDGSKHGGLRVGLVGRAKIHVEPRTLAQRLGRWFQQTFSFNI